MKISCFMTVCLIILTSPSFASGGDLQATLAESVEIREQQVAPIRSEMAAAQQSVSAEIQDQTQLVNGFRIAEQQPRIVREQEINRLRRRLAILEKLESFVDSEQEQRDQQMEDADNRLLQLQAKQRDAAKPAQEKLQALHRKYADRHQEIADVMTPFFKPQGVEPLADLKLKSISGQFQECAVYVVYANKEESVLQITTIFTTKPRFRRLPIEKLGESVSLIQLTDEYATVLAGNFQVHLVVLAKEGWSKSRIKQAITSLVDLTALANVETE